MLVAFISIICGLAAILMLLLLRNYIKRYHIDLFHALRHYIDKERPPQSWMEYKAVRLLVALVKKLAEKLPQLKFIDELTPKIRRAGLPILGAEFVVMAILLALVVGLIVYFLTLDGSFAFIAIVLAILAAVVSIPILASRRREKFVNQLGECLTTVSNALRAGFSFVQAMDLVSKEMEPPISEEFAHVMRDISYGMELDQALNDMNKRVGSYDFELVVTAVLIQHEVGGNLAQVLDSISDTINNRIRMRREVKTLTTQARMSSWILSGLPLVIAAAMIFIDSHHFDETLKNKFGFAILIGACVLEIIGFIVIRRIADIKIE